MSAPRTAPDGGERASDGAALLTHTTAAYWFVRESLRVLYRVFFRPRYVGRANLPRQGPLLVVSNHQSFLDIPLIAMAVPRHVCFVARASLARSRFMAWLMQRCGAVLIQPASSDRNALRAIAAHLDRGDCVTIFPEGTRSPDGELMPFKAGALLALRQMRSAHELRVVAAHIQGTGAVWPRARKWPRPGRIEVSFSPPLDAQADPLAEARRWIVAQRGPSA